MKINQSAVRQCLKTFDFKTLFREHLGWDNHQGQLDIPLDDGIFPLSAVAQKRGFAAYICSTIPDRPTRLKIDHQVTKSSREHLIVYADQSSGQQVWQWVRREPGKPLASRDHRFDAAQSGDPLIQRLDAIAVSLDEEEKLTVVDVAGRARAAFDVEKVTKQFYERFKAEHTAFQKFIKGINEQGDLEWYTSLMLNRMMFVYFIQKKGFLDGDTNYLRNRMKRLQEEQGKKKKFVTFYQYFLLKLFHSGLGKAQQERDAILEKLLGTVPYLNGGFFEVHQLEEKYKDIDIPDKAFERLFDFFDLYRWHLDERPLRQDNEINPDVVGYIFEKYINQKQMGAYYTKEDITEYISKNTIIPFLFDAAEKKCAVAFKFDSYLWRLLKDDPDRYIYTAVKTGVIDDKGMVIPLPKDIEAGVLDVTKREGWNKPGTDQFSLPTETWREHVARRTRCIELREKLKAGQVHSINDLITLNLDIWQFARDAIVNSEGPELLRAFWHAIEKVTILDPACGSGAFLFAALRILETLYADCLERMRTLVTEADLTSDTTPETEARALIKKNEAKHVEFKACAYKHPNVPAPDKTLVGDIAAAVASFLNAEGGNVLIGVANDGSILGVQEDLVSVNPQRKDEDSYLLWLQQKLEHHLGADVVAGIGLSVVSLSGKPIARVRVPRSPKPVYLTLSSKKVFLVRAEKGKLDLDVQEATDYISQHFNPVIQPPPEPLRVHRQGSGKRKFQDFRDVLEDSRKHPNQTYSILKSIIIGNLFGVDIMEEAVEICKLRLFLKLVAQVETAAQIEPLPDIDFNIRAGNTLVGFLTLDHVRKSMEGTLGFAEKQVERIKEDAIAVECVFKLFREQQIKHGGKVTSKDKQELRRRLEKLDLELDRYLAGEYGIDAAKKPGDFAAWRKRHQPFHWFVEFYGIMQDGGFEVIVGNPPYVEYREVSSTYTVGPDLADLGNLHGMIVARSMGLRHTTGGLAMIVPVALPSTDRFGKLRALLNAESNVWTSHFDFRPAKLFEGAEQRLTVFVTRPAATPSFFSTRYNRWYVDQRRDLFPNLSFGKASPQASLREVWPKVAGQSCAPVLTKVLTSDLSVRDVTGRSSRLYYKNTGILYYATFTREAPTCFINGKRTPSSRQTDIAFTTPQVAYAMHVLLSSTLFYVMYLTHSNCRDLNPSDIQSMRFPSSLLDDCRTQSLSDELHADQQAHSEFRIRNQKLTGEVRLQSFFPARSKPVLDRIDMMLAEHYRLTPEEVDWVINYDVKYRLGAGGEDEA